MSQDRIERDILIAAPIEHVWDLVAQPGFWVALDAAAPGTAEEGQETVATHPEYGSYPVRVEKTDPPTYLAYRWASAFEGAPLREDNTTLVEFLLTTEDDHTRLRVVETGFAALAGDETVREQAFKDNTGGWAEVLDLFRTRAEQAAA
ncbi:SRPBCC domain-containing protein [Glycomyces harbinensis]|uniref:Uncharacterized conserved protein YndB, AHSA1/START domain n=2 Tax=Glycomyces harbinensis TaxID=58114 RepID=A0A1G7DKN4_9ACTN|nr:SRPBCC domain-containing protein [Glycomyces harbinensis]SDE52072.1 Uncharacterized conserved protein YndB, AHSA1/START domain [Glycomyces harbinensis]